MPYKGQGTVSDTGPLFLCHDMARIEKFCRQDAILYRHLLHFLAPPSPEWDRAMSAYYPKGVSDDDPSAFYVDNADRIRLLANLWAGKLRIEGDVDSVSADGLRSWCLQVNACGILTTSEDLCDFLGDALGFDDWSVNFHYTVTASTFLGNTRHDVERLLPTDRTDFNLFLDRPADTPFLSIRRANDNLARDLAFMSVGLPVECHAVRVGGNIVGMITAFQMTGSCDEISRLYVAREYRHRGIGRSLLSAITRSILDRGRQPAFALKGSPDAVGDLLTGLGYRIFGRFWHRRYWWDTVEPAKKQMSSETV